MGYVIIFNNNTYKDSEGKDKNYEFKLGESIQISKKIKRNRNVDKLMQGLEDSTITEEYVFTDIKFHKEIYQPGRIEFTLQIIKGNIPEFKGSVDLKYGEDIVAKNYYIFEKVTKGEYVTYKAYSVDKFLTIDKFNMAHKGKRLVTPLSINDDPKAGGIVYTVFGLQEGTKTTKSINEFKSLIDKPVGVPWVKKLNHIGESTDDTIEAVIPYCVQYNESFLDFMVRICNRYGEFLYCEENKWHIGLEATTNVIDISNNSASYAAKYESCITEFQDEAAFLNPNYLDSECVDNKGYTFTEDSAIFKKSNGAFSQEYFQPIDYKDYAKLSDYVPPLSTAFDLLKSAEERQNFFDAVVGTSVATSLRLGIASKFQHDINTKYKTKYYEVLKDNSVEDGSNIKYEFTRNSNQVDVGFCKKILKGEEEAERNKLELEYSTYTHLLLGKKVIYDGKNYVVYRVEAGKEKDKEEYQVVMLVPEVQGLFYPLPMKQLHTRKASPQRAVVVNNFDPERLGRVQVKYPWQTKTEPLAADATPWIRVCYPMASNESGFMFFPKKDDEVLIDYEEGNIERPFVAGSFYSKTNSPSVPSSTQMVGAVKSITSDNGHHISFTDLSGYKFISDIIPLPFFSILSKFGLLSSPCTGDAAEDMLEWGKDLRKYLAGGFEIADYLGVYSIKGSTHGRNITISSPVGNVVVDAFTGITINAPHGDVNIVGKNVNIEARNNLTIQSGTNIKRPYFWHNSRQGALGILGGLAAVGTTSLMGLIGLDLSFHRTWLEVLLRPIGGTMQIKSYRFMQLEAGVGETKIMRNREQVKSLKKFKEGVMFRHAFGDNPLYTSDHWKRIVEDYNTSMCEVKEVNMLLSDIVRGINGLLSILYNKKVAGNYSKKDFEKSIKELMDLLSSKRSDVGHDNDSIDTMYEVLNEFIEMIGNRSKNIEKKIKPLDTSSFKKIEGEISKYLKEIKDKIKSINYNGDEWYVHGLNITDEPLCEYRKGLFLLIKKYLSSTDLKDLIKMDSTILKDDVDWENENSLKWANAIKVAEPLQIPQLGNLSGKDFAKMIGGTMLMRSGQAALGKLGFNDFMENDVWGQNDKGKILFSDVKGETYCLTKDGVKTAKHPNLETIAKVIENEIKNYKFLSKEGFRAAQRARYQG